MSEIRLNIDGREVVGYEGQTLVDVARANGIDIPTLCQDDRVKMYGASMGRYQDNSGVSQKNNRLNNSAVVGAVCVDYIKNGSLTASDPDLHWANVGTTGSFSTSCSSTVKRTGNYSLKLYSNSTENVGGNIKQYVSLPGAGTYTFSAYVKTDSLTVGTSGTNQWKYGARLYVMNSSDAIIGESTAVQSQNNGWERLSATFTVDGAQTVQAAVSLHYGSGTVYYDDIQLEKWEAPGSYNLLDNAGFERSEVWDLGSNLAS